MFSRTRPSTVMAAACADGDRDFRRQFDHAAWLRGGISPRTRGASPIRSHPFPQAAGVSRRNKPWRTIHRRVLRSSGRLLSYRRTISISIRPSRRTVCALRRLRLPDNARQADRLCCQPRPRSRSSGPAHIDGTRHHGNYSIVPIIAPNSVGVVGPEPATSFLSQVLQSWNVANGSDLSSAFPHKTRQFTPETIVMLRAGRRTRSGSYLKLPAPWCAAHCMTPNRCSRAIMSRLSLRWNANTRCKTLAGAGSRGVQSRGSRACAWR